MWVADHLSISLFAYQCSRTGSSAAYLFACESSFARWYVPVRAEAVEEENFAAVEEENQKHRKSADAKPFELKTQKRRRVTNDRAEGFCTFVEGNYTYSVLNRVLHFCSSSKFSTKI